MLTKILGFLAVFTSTISLVPQVIKMFNTRSVQDISMLMIVNFVLTSVFWICYGILITSKSVYVANIIMLLFSAIMLYFKLRYAEKI